MGEDFPFKTVNTSASKNTLKTRRIIYEKSMNAPSPLLSFKTIQAVWETLPYAVLPEHPFSLARSLLSCLHREAPMMATFVHDIISTASVSCPSTGSQAPPPPHAPTPALALNLYPSSIIILISIAFHHLFGAPPFRQARFLSDSYRLSALSFSFFCFHLFSLTLVSVI